MIDLPTKFAAENKKAKPNPSFLVAIEETRLLAEKATETDWGNNTAESNVDYTPSPPTKGDVILSGFPIDSWASLTAGSTSRTHSCSIVYNGKIYTFGGSKVTTKYNDVWEYNISGDSWTQRFPTGGPPSARWGMSAVEYNGKMYIFGGWDGALKNDVWELDLSTFVWTQKFPTGGPPSARQEHAAIIYDGKMYIYDGINLDKTFWRLDLSTFVWTQMASGLIQRSNGAEIEYDGKMFIFGGSQGGSYRNDVDMYDISSNTWTDLTAIGTPPYVRGFSQAIAIGGKMFIFGGYPFNSEMWEFDLGSYIWIQHTSSSTNRSGSVGGLYNGKMYIWSGNNAGGYPNTIDSYDVGYFASGYLTTDNLDLGSIPTVPGEWQTQDTKPEGTNLTYKAWSSNTNLYDVEVPLTNNQGNIIGNLAWNSTPGVTVWNQNWQSFQHNSYQTGKLGEVSGRFFKNFTGTRTIYCELWSSAKGAKIGVAVSASLTAVGTDQDLTFDFSAQSLNVESDTEYWLKFYDSAVISNDAYYVAQRYQNSDVFSAGQFDRTGNLPGTNLGDLRFTLIIKVWGNYLGTFQDGDPITTLTQYYRARADFTANTARYKTPTLQGIVADFSEYMKISDNDRLPYDTGLFAIPAITSTIDTFKASTLSEITLSLPFTKTISNYLATKEPKNKRVKVSLGFIADGFTEADYMTYFKGRIIDASMTAGRIVSLPTHDLRAKWDVPVPKKWEDAGDDVSWSNVHPVDVSLDIIQNYINEWDRHIVFSSFDAVRAAIPDWKVSRTITGDSVEAKELLNELMVLMSCIYIPTPDGSIRIKRYDSTEAHVDHLTDSDVAAPFSWKGNYDSLINESYIYHGWDGDGDKASDFSTLDFSYDATSQAAWDEIAIYTLKDKWSPTGEGTQVAALRQNILDRFADPPGILTTKVSRRRFNLEVGDMVLVTTENFPSDDFTGCADKKFQIVQTVPSFASGKNNLTLLEV